MQRRTNTQRRRDAQQTRVVTALGRLAFCLLSTAAFALVAVRGLVAWHARAAAPSPAAPAAPAAQQHSSNLKQTRYLAIASLPSTSAISLSQTNLILLAEWILIAKALNRTLVLPAIEKYRTADKSYQAFNMEPLMSQIIHNTSVTELFSSYVPLEDWFQVYPQKITFSDTVSGLHEKSDSIISPLEEYIKVIGAREWVLTMQSRGYELNQTATDRHAVSVAFVNNVDDTVECSSDHDDLLWPEWTGSQSSFGIHIKEPTVLPSVIFQRIVSDTCIFAPSASELFLAELTSAKPTVFKEQFDEDDDELGPTEGDLSNSAVKGVGGEQHRNKEIEKDSNLVNRRQLRAMENLQSSISEVAHALVGNPAVRNADLLVIRKQGNNQLFPSSFTDRLLQNTLLFPNQQIYKLIRNALRKTKNPIVAVRWSINPMELTQEESRTCAATLLKHIKKLLKMQNWHAGFLDTANTPLVPDPFLGIPRHATVFLSTTLFPYFDAQDVFSKPLKLTTLQSPSLHPIPQHLSNAYWFLRKRIRGFADLSFLFDKQELSSIHQVFWKIVEEAVFEDADIAVLGVGADCNGEDNNGFWYDEKGFQEKVKTRIAMA
ncbi:hypothetical protein BDR26DRAFT_915181 [Obelidium mucronatum]|nr:hypothetical protein BDR26DRAFT_915181 [Obelidium mucronatum]